MTDTIRDIAHDIENRWAVFKAASERPDDLSQQLAGIVKDRLDASIHALAAAVDRRTPPPIRELEAAREERP